jgi:hypothetical protein
MHASAVHGFPSPHSAEVWHGSHPAIVAWLQAPSAHVSVVQASPSPQSAEPLQPPQPATGA